MARLSRHRRGERGQTLVVMIIAMVAMIGMMGLVIDGGYLWAQQRIVQNATDSSSEAGAIVMASRLAGASVPAGGWDAEVNAKVLATAAANGLTVSAAYYTDICGIPLKPNGTAALTGVGGYDFAVAAQVGSGALPADLGTTPDCPSLTVGPPAGVLVLGHKNVDTYFARVMGITTVPITTTATAVSGWLQGFCDSSNGAACSLIPLAIPTSPLSCGGSGEVEAAPAYLGTAWQSGPTYAVPLCKSGPGNVGWVDWSPTAGGISELIAAIYNPSNPAIDLPSWHFVSQTGNTNSGGVEDAINSYNGQVVLVPMFDVTCKVTPDFANVAIPNSYGCSDLGGTGQNDWYRFPSFAAFRLCGGGNACTIGSRTYTQGAYMTGNVSDFCNSQGTQNWGGGGCLVGQFVNIIKAGTVGANGGGGTSPSKVVGVQLVK